MNNPFARRWVREFGGNNEPDPDERQGIAREAQEAEDTPTYPCDHEGCDGTCYYRPGVGGWWCLKCGKLPLWFTKRNQ